MFLLGVQKSSDYIFWPFIIQFSQEKSSNQKTPLDFFLSFFIHYFPE